MWLFIGSWVYGSQVSNTELMTYTEGCITQEQYGDMGGNKNAFSKTINKAVTHFLFVLFVIKILCFTL